MSERPHNIEMHSQEDRQLDSTLSCCNQTGTAISHSCCSARAEGDFDEAVPTRTDSDPSGGYCSDSSGTDSDSSGPSSAASSQHIRGNLAPIFALQFGSPRQSPPISHHPHPPRASSKRTSSEIAGRSEILPPTKTLPARTWVTQMFHRASRCSFPADFRGGPGAFSGRSDAFSHRLRQRCMRWRRAVAALTPSARNHDQQRNIAGTGDQRPGVCAHAHIAALTPRISSAI